MAMPPPPGFPQGQGLGFDPIPQFNTGGYDSDGFGDEPRRNNSTKKNKDDKKNKKNAPVEIQYEGFTLEKAGPNQVGEKPSWSRVGSRPLPFDDKKLARICQKVRVQDRMGPMTALTRLSGTQQGVITRLIAKRQQDEKNKDAEWVLEGLWKEIKKHYRTLTIEVVKINVILKRQDRNSTTSGQRVATTGASLYQQSEIIDLAESVKEKKKDKEKKKKDRDEDEFWDGPPMMSGGMGMGMGMPDAFAGPGHGHGHDQHHDGPIIDVPPGPPHGHSQQPQQHHQGQHPGHGQQIPPPGGIPVGAWPPPPGQHPQHQGPMPHDGNPFQPNAPFNIPGAFEMPPGFDNQRPNHFQTRAQTPLGRHNSRSRSRSREERELRRRLSQQQDQERRDSQHRLERKLDDIQDRLDRDDRLNDVMNRVADWNLRENTPPSSADSYREGDDWWSAQGSFTPPSSPPLSAVMEGPNGTLGRGKARRDSGYGYPREYHRRSAGNVVVEPYVNNSRRQQPRIDHGQPPVRRRSDATRFPVGAPSPPRRHATTRPLLHHGNTWNGSGRDDYPGTVYAEREARPRAIAQFPAGEDYWVADFNGGGRRRYHGERRDREKERERERGYVVDERRGGRRGYL